MNAQLLRIALVALLIGPWAALTGCGCGAGGDPPDGGPSDAGDTGDDAGFDAGADAGTDAGSDVDGGVDSGRPQHPTSMVQTSGGAIVSSDTHRLRVSIGAPQPAGTRTDSTHRLTVGPQSQPE